MCRRRVSATETIITKLESKKATPTKQNKTKSLKSLHDRKEASNCYYQQSNSLTCNFKS